MGLEGWQRPASVAFVGPGDVASGAFAYWGLRGYNLAYCTGSLPAIDVVDTLTGLVGPTTINIKTDGSLDVATILGLGYAVSVTKLYDQVGTNHISQATLSKMPALTLNGIGSLPCMTFNNANGSSLGLADLTTSQPFTISWVAKRTSNTSAYNGVMGSPTLVTSFDAGANAVAIYSGSFQTASATDNVLHAVQNLYKGATSTICVDGSNTTVNPGTGSAGGSFQMGTDASNRGLTGIIAEIGFWQSDISSSFSNLNSNQHSYWGF